MRHRIVSIGGAIPLCVITVLAWAQAPSPGARPGGGLHAPMLRPALLFKEEWKRPVETADQPARHGLNVALTSAANSNPELDLQLFVPGGQLQLVEEGSAENGNNPLHVWTGLCTSPCAVAFRDRSKFADLSGLARVRFNTKMSGFHHIRPIVKLADGTWWIGDEAVGSSSDWLESEISFADLRWLQLDTTRVVTRGVLTDKIDLSKVDEVGFADLMPGSGHGPGGAADVAQIEVYGRAVARAGRD
ncbi:MAG TPA: hypothetical protein VMF64_16790 [Steroidobacteraceae bacterium]|nr:hypothetical protein [Steroidobacteraceae bacterium]